MNTKIINFKDFKNKDQEAAEAFVDQFKVFIEEETEKEIFTMRILNEIENELEILFVFTDKSVLIGTIRPDRSEGIRLRANFI